jgi:bifunctional non-homologous end joining protein LigD
MLLLPATDIPSGRDWLYEVKYDGFRCLLHWEAEIPQLISRNGTNLNLQFPEIIHFCKDLYPFIKNLLPLTFDGELVYLLNNYKSQFRTVQLRGRMRKKEAITNHAGQFPCHFVAFDILTLGKTNQIDVPLSKRKKILQAFFNDNQLPLSIQYDNVQRLQLIESYQEENVLWNQIVVHNGEGIVAKRSSSIWESAKRTPNWLKIKNWRYVTVVLTKYDKNNSYFHGAIFKQGELTEIVVFRHGLKKEEEDTLLAFFQDNGTRVSTTVWEIPPSICVDIACIDFDGKKLREPAFHAFRFDMDPTDCSWKLMQRQLNPIPETIQITSPDKPIWPKIDINKDDYLYYLQKIAPYLLPFLRERLLTVIRYPHGSSGESFYQKHCPDYAPDFVVTEKVEDIDYIVCSDIETLLWLGNQLALEFHIPFQTRKTSKPTEIVFDLDPPSVNEFSLAINAAQKMKAIFDQFKLISFVKTSGGKGLQVYIPLPEDRFSYEETRIFTQFVCQFLVEQEPTLFTTERLKKNRNNKLYLDYIQHDFGKTIIAPYSPRGSEKGLIATPLKWNEVDESLTQLAFTIPVVLERLENEMNPFKWFREVSNEKAFSTVLSQLKELVMK